MKLRLSEYRAKYHEFSAKASEVTRAAALGGIALVWVFKLDTTPASLPKDLLLPAFFFVGALGLDVLHYVVGTVIWGTFFHYHEDRLKKERTKGKRPKEETPNVDDPELVHSKWLLRVIAFFFVAKVAAVVVGYILFFQYLFAAWGTLSG